MGAGTGSEQARQHEEPSVTSQASLTADLEVELDPEDVWTLGQLIEADVVSFPPGIAQEIMTGYRILQAGGYQPESETEVTLKGSGETAGIALPEEGLGEDGSVLARRIVLSEVTTEDPEPTEQTAEEATDASHDPREAPLEPVQAVASPLAGEQTERLASALERLADGIEQRPAQPRQAQPARSGSRESSLDMQLAALTVDWALIGLGLTVATLFVIAAGLLADPVFAILGLALLGFSAFQSYPYLAEPSSEGSP